jgi:hypothetical protein
MNNRYDYEFWVHVPTDELWAVAMENATVVQACGPLDPRDTVQSLLPYLPYRADDAMWIERTRANFTRTTLPA